MIRTLRLMRRIVIRTLTGVFAIGTFAMAQDSKDVSAVGWTKSFDLSKCQFSSTGRNTYFILEPGYTLVLKGAEDEGTVKLVITVLDQTELVDSVETRVVEERESASGKLVEVSRNFFAFCSSNGGIFYFGEDVDMYKDGKVVSHEGSWRAGVEGNKAGLMMPGLHLVGSAYYQEIAPRVAMDRAWIISIDTVQNTPTGRFEHCLITEETSPLEPTAREYKTYAPGIGLIKDGDLLLVEWGFEKKGLEMNR